jgi:pSer/pThr/pTyr-binding forkhead associated (FHA) protein
MKLIIEDDEGRKTVVQVVREEITIGRQDGNTIRLTERNVSRRHARLLKDNGSLLIEDLGSYNGVRVNGEKIAGPTKIKEGDLVEIGDYDLGIQGKLDTPAPGAPKNPTLPPGALKAPAAAKPASAPVAQSAPQSQTTAQPEPSASQPAQQQSISASAGGATAIIRVSDIMKGAPQGGEVRDLQRAEMPRLVGLAGPVRGKEFYLMRSEVKFGRTDENDLSLDHQSVSRQHGRFVLDQGQWKVIDNKSANGVRVNGEEYAVSNVKSGDTLELGHLKFRFCSAGEKFTLPPEKSDEPQKSGGLKPTTAELIAAASQPGRGVPGQGAAKKGSPLALIGGVAFGVVVLVAAAYLVLGRGKRNEEGGDADDKVSGNAAVKAGDAAFKKKEFIKAGELYEKAGSGEAAPNRKRAAEEAKGEALYHQFRSSLDSGDGDKAKNIFDTCSSESSFYCQKVQEMAEAVKASFAKKHLAAANAAKTAGKLDACRAEVNNVLSFDSANAEAQSLASQCGPQETAKAEAPRHEGPSPKEREAKAAKLATDCSGKLNPAVKDFSGAVKSAQSALALGPSDKNTLGQAYRCLGYGYAYLSDRAAAVKWLEKYLPYCTNDCAQVHAFIGR